MVHTLSRQEARRIAVRTQLLDGTRPVDLLDLIGHLTLVQVDLTAAVAPNADLVCWSRLGRSYVASDLDRLLDDRAVVEFQGVLRPAADMCLYRADMRDWPGREPLREWQIETEGWVEANDLCRQDILTRLRSDGPTAARDIDDSCAVAWRSSGWNNNRNVQQLLRCMEARGEVAVSSREGRERLWDLADRVYPDDPPLPAEQAQLVRDERRLASLGIARAHGPYCGVENVDAGRAGAEAVIDGVRGTWRVDAAQLDLPFRGRAALLSPLDRLVIDRKRMSEIFGFDYQLEMYKPPARRRWGYFALPILYGDRLVGKLDAAADPTAAVLRVKAIHRDIDFTKSMRAAVDAEIRDLARMLELDLDLPS